MAVNLPSGLTVHGTMIVTSLSARGSHLKCRYGLDLYICASLRCWSIQPNKRSELATKRLVHTSHNEVVFR